MMSLLQPNLVLGATIFDLTPQTLREHDISGLILGCRRNTSSFKQKELLESYNSGSQKLEKLLLFGW